MGQSLKIEFINCKYRYREKQFFYLTDLWPHAIFDPRLPKNKLSRRLFFVREKIPNPTKRPAYLKNSGLRNF